MSRAASLPVDDGHVAVHSVRAVKQPEGPQLASLRWMHRRLRGNDGSRWRLRVKDLDARRRRGTADNSVSLAAGVRQDLIENGLRRCAKLEPVQECHEATAALVDPALDLRKHAR